MVPPKVWTLLNTVGCEDIYGFLGIDRDASLEELQAAAERKYEAIHNQSARSEGARAGAALAGLCKSAIFKSAENRREYDREAARRSEERRAGAADGQFATAQERQRAASAAASAAAVAAASAAAAGAVNAGASAVEYVEKYCSGIAAAGAVLIVSGAALAAGVSAPAGAVVLGLGTAVFPCGFVAVLYRQSRERIVHVGGVGLVLVVLGIMGEGYPSNRIAEGTASSTVLTVVAASRLLGGLVLLCGLVSFGLQGSWHVKVADTARPVVDWWRSRIGAGNPAIVLGVTGVALAGVMGMVVGPVVSIVFGLGAAGVVGSVVSAIASYSGLLIGAGVVWRFGKGFRGAPERDGDLLECRSCGTRAARSRCREGSGFGRTYRCPVCGSEVEG